MKFKNKNLGIIPARAGSKGIKRKNIQEIGDKPMIEYTFDASRKSKLLDEVLLSTNDLEIIELGKKNKINVPFVRPEELALDDTSMVDVIDHALKNFNQNYGYFPSYFILLSPTSPFRDNIDIDNAIIKFLESGKDSLVSVCSVTQHPAECVSFDKNEKLEFIKFDNMNLSSGRQSYKPYYFIDGAIYICKTNAFYDKFLNKKILFDNDSSLYKLKNSHSIDINDPYDLILARALYDFYKLNTELEIF